MTTASEMAHERTLPVAEALQSIVPSGRMQRGSTLAVHGVGATSFALAMAGEAVRDGSFLAVVAPPSFGLAACLDFDIPLRRVVQFVLRDDKNWAQAVAAIVEGFDVVLLADRRRVRPAQARQLTARNRERGSVLVRVGGPAWPDAADVRFDVRAPTWSGLGQGHGHLVARQVDVQVAGRRYHGRGQAHSIMLPAAAGGVEQALPAVADIAAGARQFEAARGRVEVGRGAAAETVKAVGERHAGADIDAFLDVIDGQRDSGDPSDAVASDDVVSDLDAIA